MSCVLAGYAADFQNSQVNNNHSTILKVSRSLCPQMCGKIWPYVESYKPILHNIR